MPARSRRLDRTLQGIVAGTLAALLAVAGAKAQPPAAPTPPAAEPAAPTLPALSEKQQKNAEKFKEFKEGLFRLAKRLEKSERPEDKETAKIILAAIEQAQKAGVDQQFQKLVLGLQAGNLAVNDLKNLEGEGAQLSKMLKEIYEILMTDDEAAKLRAEIARLELILKNAKEIKNAQERLTDITQSKIGDTKNIANQQERLKERTEDLRDQMNGKNPKDGQAGKGGPKKDDRAEAKSEPKPGEAGEPKPETGEEKGAPKDGEPKDSQGEPKGEGKGEPKDGKPGEAKEGKPNDAGEPKAGEPKDGGKPGDPKPGEPKPGDAKGQGQGKGEPKPSEAGMGGEGKPQGEPKAGGSPPPSQSKGGGEPKPPGQGGGSSGTPPPPKNDTPGRKEVQDAIPYQEQAKKDLDKTDRSAGGKNQDKATEELAKAIAELEKRLKQLREEEMKKLLANVEARVGKMLQMQIDVFNATVAIDKAVQKNGGAKTVADTQKAQQQGDKEKEIVAEADRALKLLESEGSAVAFARVLEEVRQDMIAVQRRLSQSVVNADTQEIEKNIIDMLTEMKEALKKAQQEPKEPKEGKPGEAGKPGNKKLIDLIAELKLIRSMQVQVNKRTEMHGKKDAQTDDAIVQAELRQLSARQAKLQDMLEKIATGANQ